MRWLLLPLLFGCASVWASLELPHWAINREGVCSFFLRAQRDGFVEAAHLDLARRMGFAVPSDNLTRLKTDIVAFLNSHPGSLEGMSQGNIGPLIEHLRTTGDRPYREDFLFRALPQVFLDFDLVREIPEYRATSGLAPYYFAPGQRENRLKIYWRFPRSDGHADVRAATHEHFSRVTSPRPFLIEEVIALPGNEKDNFTVFTAQVSLSSQANP